MNKRNFILLGHAQSGKTTLSECILYSCGATNRKGSVVDGTTVSDYSFDEIERKSSINASLLFCDYKGTRIQFIDAPGYLDFWGEIVSGIRAVDNVVIVVDASTGIEVGTERAWQLAEEEGLPCIFFINKIDKEETNPQKTILDLQNTFSKKITLIDNLDSPELLELIAESDDALLEKYLEGKNLTPEELVQGLKQAIIRRKIFPVVIGCALQDKGIDKLLRIIVDFMADPTQRPQPKAKDPTNPQEKKEIRLSEDAPFSAFVFKTIVDPYVGQLSLFRVFSGTVLS
ncbi:MAG: GTP-binding protein, partial [Candidatus Omnitrophica bacterium]|nr:GTP-binding protein [Candidatus Omnitrophota bacterium]